MIRRHVKWETLGVQRMLEKIKPAVFWGLILQVLLNAPDALRKPFLNSKLNFCLFASHTKTERKTPGNAKKVLFVNG